MALPFIVRLLGFTVGFVIGCLILLLVVKVVTKGIKITADLLGVDLHEFSVWLKSKLPKFKKKRRTRRLH